MTTRLAELEAQLAARGVVAPGGTAPVMSTVAPAPTGGPAQSGIRQVHVSRLVPNPKNKRDLGDLTELAASVRVLGVLQPLIAAPGPDGKYMLSAGHRRLAAAKLAGLDTVPVDVRASRDSAAPDVIRVAENFHRKDMSAVEKAEELGGIRDDHGWTAAEIAKATGLGASAVSRYLALLELDEESRERVRNKTVKVEDALNAVKDARAMQRAQPGRRPAHGQPVKPRPASKPVRLEPPHFTRDHPVAPAAELLCDHQGTRPLLAGICQPCWEKAIRADERARGRRPS